jgi:hypothetical protein
MKKQGCFGPTVFLLALFFSPAFAADEQPGGKTQVAPVQKNEKKIVNTSPVIVDTGASKAQSEKLYTLFNKSYTKTIAQIQCLKDLECINSEDDVLKYSIFNIRLLQKLEDIAAKNDLWAMYYRGLIAYERAEDYADRASYVRDRDFIFTAMVLNRKRNEQFVEAKKFLTEPAAARIPEACQYMGNILAKGLGTKVNIDRAMDFYYCAALEYINADRSLEARIALKMMTQTGTPTDARTVDVFAKINKNR